MLGEIRGAELSAHSNCSQIIFVQEYRVLMFNSFFAPENTSSRFAMICRRARLRSNLVVRFALVSISLGLAVLALLTLPPQSGARISPPQVSKSKKQQRPKFVLGDVLVRYRSESMAKSKSGKSSLLATSEGRLVSARVEHFDGSDLVSGLRIARVAPEATLDAVAALRKQPAASISVIPCSAYARFAGKAE